MNAESKLEVAEASLIISNAKCKGLEQEVLELRSHISDSSRPSNEELGVQAESELEVLKASLVIANAKCKGLEREVIELRSHIPHSCRPTEGSNGELGVQEPPRSAGSDLLAAGLASGCQSEPSQEEPPRKRRAVPGTSRQAEPVMNPVGGHPADVDAIDKDRAAAEMHPKGYGALHVAAREGDVKTLRELLARGFDPRVQGREGETPLHCALDYGQMEAADLLVQEDSGNDVEDVHAWTPLHKAACKGWEEIVRMLVIAGARLRHQNNRGQTALHCALLGYGNQVTAQFLLNEGSENDVPNKNGDTPLHLAVDQGYAGIVKELLSSGTCPHIKNQRGEYPLSMAASAGHDDIVKMIIAVYAWRGIEFDEEDLFPSSSRHSPPFLPEWIQHCKDLLSECKAEIGRMKETAIGGSTVTYHDIAAQHVSSVTKYLRNKPLHKELLSGRIALYFPNYADLIVQKVRRAEKSLHQ